MKIKTIKIKNFKSIKDITINCNEGINTFIGKNGTGKSAVFEAVNLILGNGNTGVINIPNYRGGEYDIKKYWKEYWLNDNDKTCEIIVEFEDKTVSKFLKMANSSFVMEGTKFGSINFVPSQRSFDDMFKIDRGFLGRYVLSRETIPDYKKFTERLSQILGCKIEAYPKYIDSTDVANSSRLYESVNFIINNVEIELESSGKQASFVLGMMQALSETNLNFNNIIFIDEPELHLHPHAKKSLYNRLKKLANDGIQIFYITHSSEFLSCEDSDEIHRFYIDGKNGTKNAKGSKSNGITERQKMIEPDKISFNNAFFADAVFLVEGYTDEVFLRYVFENKSPTRTIDECNISIVNCSSKDNIVRFYELYSSLKIKCFALYDKDQTLPPKNKKGEKYTKKDIASNEKQRDENNKGLKEINGYGFEENLEHFLTGELQFHLENDKKRKIVQDWISEKANPSQRQEKIDIIWKEISRELGE